jgi:hypothetical protein
MIKAAAHAIWLRLSIIKASLEEMSCLLYLWLRYYWVLFMLDMYGNRATSIRLQRERLTGLLRWMETNLKTV